MTFLRPLETSIEPLQVQILPQDIENIYSEMLGENKVWIPMIWHQQCCDSDEGKEDVKQYLESFVIQSCRAAIDNCWSGDLNGNC